MVAHHFNMEQTFAYILLSIIKLIKVIGIAEYHQAKYIAEGKLFESSAILDSVVCFMA